MNGAGSAPAYIAVPYRAIINNNHGVHIHEETYIRGELCLGRGIADLVGPRAGDDAARIVEAVNAHAALVADNERLRAALASLVEWSMEGAKDSPDCAGWRGAMERAVDALAGKEAKS